MAFLDREREVIVIRVVYDGPPEAGKTTSLRALAGSLGQNLKSPVEEYGRTLYFDWMDYTAGRFEGYQIRCQIVSVPGQRELAPRRWRLIKDADVVVFVGDSTNTRLVESLECLRELSRFLSRTASQQVGVIFQANKRDLPNAMPLEELKTLIHAGGSSIGVVESVASEGTGIREAFVFAVRLALDRVREQLNTRTLTVGRPEIDSSEDLMEYLRSREPQSNHDSAPMALPLMRQVLHENDDTATQATPWHDVSVPVGDEERPRSPDPSAPSGSIWPPVEGRLILQEAASTRMTTHRLRSGGWTAGIGNGWRIFSSAETVFNDVEAGRETLVRVARLHAACKSLLSVNRCIVLATTGLGTWRLPRYIGLGRDAHKLKLRPARPSAETRHSTGFVPARNGRGRGRRRGPSPLPRMSPGWGPWSGTRAPGQWRAHFWRDDPPPARAMPVLPHWLCVP